MPNILAVVSLFFPGVIGENYSSLSDPLARFLAMFNIPQISFSATASSLSDKEVYPYFMRTTPNDDKQAVVSMGSVDANTNFRN